MKRLLTALTILSLLFIFPRWVGVDDKICEERSEPVNEQQKIDVAKALVDFVIRVSAPDSRGEKSPEEVQVLPAIVEQIINLNNVAVRTFVPRASDGVHPRCGDSSDGDKKLAHNQPKRDKPDNSIRIFVSENGNDGGIASYTYADAVKHVALLLEERPHRIDFYFDFDD